MKDMKKKQMKVLAVICAIFAVCGLGAAIYAAGFSSTINSAGHKGLVTSWSVAFGADNYTDEVAQANKTLSISESDIAPGSSGSFDVIVGNKSDVAATVYVDFYNARVGKGENFTALNQSENNIRFYKDADFTSEIAINESTAHTELTSYDINDGSVAAKNGTYTKTIYWRWVGSDVTYTDESGVVQSVDNKIAGQEIKVDFKVVVKQVNPGVNPSVNPGE